MAVTSTAKPTLEASTAGVPYSSIVMANTSSPLAARAGSVRGRVTRHSACQGLAPQTRATTARRPPAAAAARDTAKYTTGNRFSTMTSTTPGTENSSPAACWPVTCCR